MSDNDDVIFDPSMNRVVVATYGCATTNISIGPPYLEFTWAYGNMVDRIEDLYAKVYSVARWKTHEMHEFIYAVREGTNSIDIFFVNTPKDRAAYCEYYNTLSKEAANGHWQGKIRNGFRECKQPVDDITNALLVQKATFFIRDQLERAKNRNE